MIFCEAVYRFFVENQIQQKLKVMENCFAEKKELALAKRVRTDLSYCVGIV